MLVLRGGVSPFGVQWFSVGLQGKHAGQQSVCARYAAEEPRPTAGELLPLAVGREPVPYFHAAHDQDGNEGHIASFAHLRSMHILCLSCLALRVGIRMIAPGGLAERRACCVPEIYVCYLLLYSISCTASSKQPHARDRFDTTVGIAPRNSLRGTRIQKCDLPLLTSVLIDYTYWYQVVLPGTSWV